MHKRNGFQLSLNEGLNRKKIKIGVGKNLFLIQDVSPKRG